MEKDEIRRQTADAIRKVTENIEAEKAEKSPIPPGACPTCKSTNGNGSVFMYGEWIPCPTCNGNINLYLGG